MPIYDYTCGRCGRLTEVIHGIHDGGPKFCPSCGAEGTMRKGITTSAVHFKGSGWAKKDRASASSASRSRGAKSGAESGPDSEAAGSSDTSSGGRTSGDAATSGGNEATSSGNEAASTTRAFTATGSADGGE